MLHSALRNSFTSLIPDLVRSRNIDFDADQRRNLSEFVIDAVYEASSNAKYAEFSLYWRNTGEERYLNSYTGLSNISLPYKDHGFDCKAYKFGSAALSGSVSTPYFGKPFDEDKFEKEFLSEIYIYISEQIADGGYLVVDIEYDIEESSDDYIWIREEKFDEFENEYIYDGHPEYIPRVRDGHIIKYFYAAEYDEQDNDDFFKTGIKLKKRIVVRYYRNIHNGYSIWKAKRNTGMKVSWRYEPAPATEVRAEERYVEDNKLFILLANIVHQYNGTTEELEDLVKTISKEKQKEKQTLKSEVCRNLEDEKITSNTFKNISTKPIYNPEITNESLGKISLIVKALTDMITSSDSAMTSSG